MMQEFVQRLKEMAGEAVNGIHTAIPGQIVAFDPATCLAVVAPSMKYKKPDGSTLPYPNISGVPVYFPQGAGQNASIAYPVKAGDGCLIVVSEQSLDYWMYQRETDSELRFDPTNSIALVGLFTKAGPGVERACAENAIVVTAGSTVLAVTPGGVDITGNLTVKGEITAIGDVVGGGSVSLVTHTHAGVHGETSAPS